MIELRPAERSEQAAWTAFDPHITDRGFARLAACKTGFFLLDGGRTAGVLRYGFLWDTLPFLQHLLIAPQKRRRGYGRQAMAGWEEKMREAGCSMVLTSTQADEEAQFFYRALGYQDCGCLILRDCPLEQPLEIFLCKTL